MNLLLVVGGYNSSNTSHLAEMGEEKLPTYFVRNASRLLSEKEILHYDLHQRQEVIAGNWLPAGRSSSALPRALRVQIISSKRPDPIVRAARDRARKLETAA